MVQLQKLRERSSRRAEDIKRELLEESIKELPKYFVTILDHEKGLYSFYYARRDEAQEMVEALISEGIPEENIAVYHRAF